MPLKIDDLVLKNGRLFCNSRYPPSSKDNDPVHADICHENPVTSIRWELFRQGLEDVEYLAMLDRLAGIADEKYSCGYEAAVLRGPKGRVGDTNATAPLSACCTSLGGAKAALDAVSDVIWGIAPNWSIKGAAAEPGGENAVRAVHDGPSGAPSRVGRSGDGDPVSPAGVLSRRRVWMGTMVVCGATGTRLECTLWVYAGACD